MEEVDMSRRSWGGGSLYYDSYQDLWVGQMQTGILTGITR